MGWRGVPPWEGVPGERGLGLHLLLRSTVEEVVRAEEKRDMDTIAEQRVQLQEYVLLLRQERRHDIDHQRTTLAHHHLPSSSKAGAPRWMLKRSHVVAPYLEQVRAVALCKIAIDRVLYDSSSDSTVAASSRRDASCDANVSVLRERRSSSLWSFCTPVWLSAPPGTDTCTGKRNVENRCMSTMPRQRQRRPLLGRPSATNPERYWGIARERNQVLRLSSRRQATGLGRDGRLGGLWGGMGG